MKGKTGFGNQSYQNQLETLTEEKRPHPIRDYIKYSSCCIFHKKSRFRKAVFKVVINPDYEFKESRKVEFDSLALETQEDLLNQGFNTNTQYLHRDSTIMTIKYVAQQNIVI